MTLAMRSPPSAPLVPASLTAHASLDTAPGALEPAQGDSTLVVSGSLRRDLLRLGVAPCAIAALTLTGWFTHSRLDTLEAAFNTEGQAIARQVAALSDLSLYAGDLQALQNVANAALRGAQVTRVEISNNAGVFVAAGAQAPSMENVRVFTAPVTLRESSRASAFSAPAQTLAAEQPLGLVQAFRDTTAHTRERTRSLVGGIGIALIALLVAWASVRHMARTVTRPLRRVSRTVAALEAGQFDARCDVVGAVDPGDEPPATRRQKTHEIANLAFDVNRLAERLQRNQQLSEERVREATSVALQRMAQAEQAALSRARFLAAASHDLRQPLHAMGLFIDGLRASATPAQRMGVERLHESTQFMGVLLDDLLEISRLDAQVLTPTLGAVPLAPLFLQLSQLHAEQAAQGGIRLRWRDGGHVVRSDAALLLRVVGNLVSNAIRHAAPDGTVLVAARPAGAGRLRIEVRDNGIGIAPIHQARIFEEFYQVGNAERDRRQGFGLGLSICARVAALLGTQVSVRSSLQRGSTFSLVLPLARLQDVAAAPPPVAVAPLTGLRCLVVDDDNAILEGSRALLARWGCHADCAETADAAIALLGAPDAAYDVVLCDLQLESEDDGMRVIDSARRLQPASLAVLVSGATGPEALQQLRQRGVNLLTKPVAPAKLRALLSTRRHAPAPSSHPP